MREKSDVRKLTPGNRRRGPRLAHSGCFGDRLARGSVSLSTCYPAGVLEPWSLGFFSVHGPPNVSRTQQHGLCLGQILLSLAHVYDGTAVPGIIDIVQLDYRYAEAARSAPLALKQINLQVDRGTTVGLIGPNGGGKTTLVKLLIGLLTPTQGSIRIDGMAPAQAVRRGDVIGYLPQSAARPERFPLNVRQAVLLGLAGKTGFMRSASPADVEFADHLLERVGVADLAKKPIGQLSGGQLQRVLIARALVPRPKILLLDEPTTGVDRLNQAKFIEFLQSLQQELGLTVMIVTHDLRAVSAIADRIACLNSTLHYHDVPERLPADLVYRMFACDLQAMGIGGEHKGCGDEMCQHDKLMTNDEIRMTNQ
jgi:zinc transport system ATP-binding protein